jgi:hypothetical protein
MAAMITICAEQAGSHALRATSLPDADPISMPDGRRMGRVSGNPFPEFNEPKVQY